MHEALLVIKDVYKDFSDKGENLHSKSKGPFAILDRVQQTIIVEYSKQYTNCLLNQQGSISWKPRLNPRNGY
jgi:hypothetical protein